MNPAPQPQGVIAVEVVIPEGCPSFGGAVLRGRIDDESMADEGSETLVFREVAPVEHRQGRETRVRVELPRARRPGARLCVNVHVDRNGNGQVEAGDLINVRSYALGGEVSADADATMEVQVREV